MVLKKILKQGRYGSRFLVNTILKPKRLKWEVRKMATRLACKEAGYFIMTVEKIGGAGPVCLIICQKESLVVRIQKCFMSLQM